MGVRRAMALVLAIAWGLGGAAMGQGYGQADRDRPGDATIRADLARAPAERPGEPVRVQVRKIWDAAPHNAFTDLVRFKDGWLCAFREGRAHASPDGALRILASPDGR